MMSALNLICLKLRAFSQALRRYYLLACKRVYQILPVVIAVITSAFTVIACIVLVLLVAHVDELRPSVGIGTTIIILIGSIGLFVSTIGVLIATLRYASERGSGSKTFNQSIGKHQTGAMTTQQQKDENL